MTSSAVDAALSNKSPASVKASVVAPSPTGVADADVFDEDEEPYWMDQDWVPEFKSGKQRSPNQIRGELQRYIKSSGCAIGKLMAEFGVNNKSYYVFMNPKNYKDQWSATENGTYWAAARFLEAKRNAPKTPKKRKSSSPDEGNNGAKKTRKAELKEEARKLMELVSAIEGVDSECVYDSCPRLVKKTREFLDRDGVTKADFCKIALGGVSNTSLTKFMSARHHEQCHNHCYPKTWAFFEKLRILEGAEKTNTRLTVEREYPEGYPLFKSYILAWDEEVKEQV